MVLSFVFTFRPRNQPKARSPAGCWVTSSNAREWVVPVELPHHPPSHDLFGVHRRGRSSRRSSRLSSVTSQGQAVAMSYATRSLSSQQMRATSSASSSSHSPALVSRIEEKKAELQNLKELRDLSAAVANQMEALEQKFTTLSDGTEGKSLDHKCFLID